MRQMDDDVDGFTVHVIIVSPNKVVPIRTSVKRFCRTSPTKIGKTRLVLFGCRDGDLLAKRSAVLLAHDFLKARIKCAFFFR
jgi:hypothetical protein